MGYTLYDATIVNMQHGLKSLAAILKKAEDTAPAKNLTTEKLFESRLYEDMLPLAFQVHVVTDVAQKAVARCTGKEPQEFARDELKTMADCTARIEKTAAILDAATPDAINGGAEQMVPCGMGPGKTIHLRAQDYVNGYALPNFFFHLTTAYAILRKEGIELGKGDYLGSFLGPYAS